MEPIRVPGPPPEAFNKNRPVSDLIRAQVNHFKHLEQKLSAEQRQGIPQHGISTEGEAARYIAAMTAFMIAQPAAAGPAGPEATTGIRLVSSRPATVAEPAEGLEIAASADTETTPGGWQNRARNAPRPRRPPAVWPWATASGSGKTAAPAKPALRKSPACGCCRREEDLVS